MLIYGLYPMTLELIYLAPSTESAKQLNQLITVKGLDLMKNENDEITIFFHLCIYMSGGFLNLLW